MAKITTTTGSDADLTLEPDGTGDINLTPGTNGDVNIPANKGITFGNDGEKIEGNATKLDIAAAEIDFSIEAGGDINIGTDIGLTFGAAGEKIEGDGTNLTVSSSGNFTVDATGDIILDAGGADVTLKDGGTAFGTLKQASGHLVIQPTSSKEIILNDQAGTASLTIDTADQNVSINNGNLVISSATGGITFGGDPDSRVNSPTVGDRTLYDYEEGTWDAQVADHVGNNLTMDGDYDTGYYTKIGNLCHVQGFFQTTSLGSASTVIRITGLPFNAVDNNAGYTGGGVAYASGLALATATASVFFNISKSTSYLDFNVGDVATGSSALTTAEWSDDGKIMIGFSYRVA